MCTHFKLECTLKGPQHCLMERHNEEKLLLYGGAPNTSNFFEVLKHQPLCSNCHFWYVHRQLRSTAPLFLNESVTFNVPGIGQFQVTVFSWFCYVVLCNHEYIHCLNYRQAKDYITRRNETERKL